MKYLSIPHYRGLKEKYDEQKYGDGIFFTTDTHEIIANNATYGETINTWSIADGVLTLTMTSGKTLEITFDEATESVKGFLSAEDKKKINSLEGNFDKKVDKVPGKSLVDDTDIAKLSELPSNSDLNNKLDTKLDKSAVESTVTADSNNPVSSAAINTYISNTVITIKNNVTRGVWLPLREGDGNQSIREGMATSANGRASHAEGVSTADGDYSHAEGHSSAIGKYSHAQGCNNYENASFIDVVGVCPTNSSEHKNASVIFVNRTSSGEIAEGGKTGYQYLLGVGGYQGQAIEEGMKSVQEVFADLENNKVDKTDMITITDDEIDEMFNK